VKVLQHSAQVDAVGTAVVVVHDPPELLGRTMLRDLQIPYPVLIDRELDAYRRWGLGRAGRARTLLSPQVLAGYAKSCSGASGWEAVASRGSWGATS